MPSLGRLSRATLIAAVVAGGILVTTVLQAEYRADPTGIGGMLGLTTTGEMKNGEPVDVTAPDYATPLLQQQRRLIPTGQTQNPALSPSLSLLISAAK